MSALVEIGSTIGNIIFRDTIRRTVLAYEPCSPGGGNGTICGEPRQQQGGHRPRVVGVFMFFIVCFLERVFGMFFL